MRKNIYLFLLYAVYILLALGVPYSCSQKELCPKGIELLSLICNNFRGKACTTPKEQLEDVSEKMRQAECEFYENNSLKFAYACYLCSQYNVVYDVGFSTDLSKDTEKEVEVFNEDVVTMNYIKGLDLLSQLCFTSYLAEEHTKYVDEFSKCLKRLKIGNVSLRIYIMNFDKQVAEIEELCNKGPVIMITAKGQKKIKDDTNVNQILYVICDALEKINNENILDGFLRSYNQNMILDTERNIIIGFIERWYKLKKNLSDYMKYLYSFVIDNRKYCTKNINIESISKHIFSARETIPSDQSHRYLLSRVEEEIPFKNKYIRHLFYYKLAVSFQYFKEFNTAIKYYGDALECEYDAEAFYNLSKCYFELKEYEKAANVFEEAYMHPNYSDRHKKFLKHHIPYYLNLLTETGQIEEYKDVLFTYNREIAENCLRRKKNVSIIKKNIHVRSLESNSKSNFNLYKNSLQPKALIPKSISEKLVQHEYPVNSIVIENCKKEYRNMPCQEKKHRRTSSPAILEQGFVQKEEASSDVSDNHSIKNSCGSAHSAILKIESDSSFALTIEDLIKGNPLKIFYQFFSCYDNPPIMDSKLKISQDNIKNLMRALNFPFSCSEGKGSHRKGTLFNKDDGSNKQMIIIPVHGPYLEDYSIELLRKVFISVGLYPEDKKEILVEAGLIRGL